EQLTLNERWALNTKSDGTKAIYGRTAKTSATGQTRRSLFGHCGVPDDVHPHPVHDSGTWADVLHPRTSRSGSYDPRHGRNRWRGDISHDGSSRSDYDLGFRTADVVVIGTRGAVSRAATVSGDHSGGVAVSSRNHRR